MNKVKKKMGSWVGKVHVQGMYIIKFIKRTSHVGLNRGFPFQVSNPSLRQIDA